MSAPARPTGPQIELMRAIDAGHVADTYHLRLRSWATRRTDRRSAGPGGGQGRNVTAAARRLYEMAQALAAHPRRAARTGHARSQGA